jgi:hypothetical protein
MVHRIKGTWVNRYKNPAPLALVYIRHAIPKLIVGSADHHSLAELRLRVGRSKKSFPHQKVIFFVDPVGPVAMQL